MPSNRMNKNIPKRDKIFFIFDPILLYKLMICVVRKAGLEPARRKRHYPLKIACLPIPPLPQTARAKIVESTININIKEGSAYHCFWFNFNIEVIVPKIKGKILSYSFPPRLIKAFRTSPINFDSKTTSFALCSTVRISLSELIKSILC